MLRRVLLACLVLLAAIVLQLTVVNGLPLPGGSPPGLVLVVVVALAVTGGQLEGALAGFGAGLALDVAPPAAHLLGRDALVFCLVGYGTGLLRGGLEHSAWLRLAAVVAGTAVGEALLGLVGVMFSEPDISWPAVAAVLPVAVCYGAALSPFVLDAIVRLRAWAGAEPGRGMAMGGELAAAAAVAAAPLAGLAGTNETVRSTGTGRTPRLRPAGRPADGWIGGAARGPGPAGSPLPRRPLNLRLRGGQAGSAAATVPRQARPPARPVSLRLGGSRGERRRGDRVPAASFRSAARRLGAGGERRAPRPGAAAVLPSGTFRGGPSAASAARRVMAPRQVTLRLGTRRRGDGMVGSRLLAGPGRRGEARGGKGPGAVPRFRSGQGPTALPRRRAARSSAAPRFGGGGGLARFLPGGRGRRGGLGGRAGAAGGGLGGALPGTRLPGRKRGRRSRGRPWRRSKVWRIGTGRTGGLA